jgi:hypothetical protein
VERQNGEFGEFIDRVSRDLRSPDTEERERFFAEFGGELEAYEHATGTALGLWDQFRNGLPDNDERRVAVAGIAFTAINSHLSSLKLFLSGYAVASGTLFRLTLEGISLAALCSVKSLPMLKYYLQGRYSTKNAVRDLARHRKEAGVRADGVKVVQDQYERYHEFAHLTRLTIAAGADFSRMGVPQLGAFFDPGKLHGYRVEFRSRTSFARVLPNFIAGVARNVAGW